MQSLGGICSTTQIQIPDAGFGFDLLQIFTAIGSKNKGDFICTPLADNVVLMFSFNTLGIFLALVVNYRRNVNSGFLASVYKGILHKTTKNGLPTY